MAVLDEKTKNTIAVFQKNEITEHYIYKQLASFQKDRFNRSVLEKIADEELRHYQIWSQYTGRKVKPSNLKRYFYVAIAAVFGISFAIKLMEKGEKNAQISYDKVTAVVSEAAQIYREENEHENQLIEMIQEEKLKYMGSVVLGLNDALVEFTGALAGLTLAMQNSRLIGTAGIIIGISASLSMAASEYLSTKTEAADRNPKKASFYTGLAYILTVLLLVGPFLLLQNYFAALALTIFFAVLLIFVFTFYFSVVRDIPFASRFLEMLFISMGVAALSFAIGLFVRKVLNIDV